MIHLALFVILGVILVAPFSVKRIEEELEIFLFIMGGVTVTITSQWSAHLIEEAVMEPIKIAAAVLIAGMLFRLFQKSIAKNIERLVRATGLKFFVFSLIVLLGLLSSMITAIIAALALVEIIHCLGLERKSMVRLTVIACFAIGLGAALTPIGEPLSTIVVSKLKGEPYQAGFLFLFQQLWHYVFPGVIIFAILGAVLISGKHRRKDASKSQEAENFKDIFIRALKVYFFVMALIFLGKGFKPIIDTYISKMPDAGLFWVNTVSAVLDNATIAAAEISPAMTILQIKSALLGLLIAGGMLIPGNIPNIISAGKLKIKSSEWAKFAVPLGLAAMIICFFLLELVRMP
ncbi:MAG: DUF1646 family protein [Candidatus Omnitrophica bacterium]|nr:DUF1646 family protein [Candidatus Omnitrophota bacterium]MDD5652942.1 DUF1646 family protein [Candidatus Omnitrophota bacterium]